MREDPLDPNTIVFFFKDKLLKSFCIKMANIFSLEDFLCFFDIFFALVNNIHSFVDLTKQFLGNSSNSSSTVNYSVSCVFWMVFEKRENKLKRTRDITRAQIFKPPKNPIIRRFRILHSLNFTSQY